MDVPIVLPVPASPWHQRTGLSNLPMSHERNLGWCRIQSLVPSTRCAYVSACVRSKSRADSHFTMDSEDGAMVASPSLPTDTKFESRDMVEDVDVDIDAVINAFIDDYLAW